MHSKRLAHWITAVLCLSTVVLACSRGKDYLYMYTPQPLKTQSLTAQIKGVTHPKVDVLFAMGNMNEHATQLALGVASFIASFSARAKVDWKMGMVGDDGPPDNPWLGFLLPFDNNTPDPVGTFVNAVGQLQSSNGASEKLFAADLDIMNSYPHFLRPDATLGLVFINDNSDESGMSAKQFMDKVSTFTGGMDHVYAYGVFGSDDFGCSDDDESWNYQGSTYNTLITTLHGFAVSLCNDDFGTSLSKISDDLITHTLHPEILLTGRPDPKSIRVLYNGILVPAGLKGQERHPIHRPELRDVRLCGCRHFLRSAGLIHSRETRP
jgi:hypothetical protein